MSKYDFELDLSMNSSTGMILNKIKPHSDVLEFGCAAGRMTRYMKETLGCRVCIVENDESAFEKAKEFACDGICDDIRNDRWLERFAETAFDAIIFADVLEHLQDPEDVLKKASGLLKADGCMYVSVPNVTHNDIVLKSIDEHFDYTQTGLLDNSHIHFWGLENIRTLGKDAGLTIRKLEGTYCPMGSTEQRAQIGKNLLLDNLLRERAAGEIYQFVLTLDKQGTGETVCAIGAPTIFSHIYLDTGNDFNVQERFAVKAVSSGDGSYTVHDELMDGEPIRRVRLDPVEGQGVILRRIRICKNGREQDLIMPNAVEVHGGTYLCGDDPMVMAQMQPGAGIVTVEAEFVLPGTQYLAMLEAAVAEKQQRLQVMEQQNRQLEAAVAEKQQRLQVMEQQNRQLEADVHAYMLLTNQKEKLMLNLEQQTRTDAARIQELEDTAARMIQEQESAAARMIQEQESAAARIQELEGVVAHYQNLKVIRIRAWVGRALRKIKRCAKKLLKRG